MKLHQILKCASIIALFSIYLYGEMLGLPLLFFMIISLVAGETETLVTSLLSFTGIICLYFLNKYRKTKWTILLEVVLFFFIALPIIDRLVSVSLYLFNYSLFIIPTVAFILLYFSSVILSYRDFLNQKKEETKILDELLMH